MSTAGKVLVVLLMLGTVVWMVLTAGVAQLNTNYSKVLYDLSAQYDDLSKEMEEAKRRLATLQDNINTRQEKTDIDLTVLRARLSGLEKARSQIIESLTRAQYQATIVEETIKGARETIEHRNVEQRAEERALADAKAEVQTLLAESSRLRDELRRLRETFQSTYRANRDLLK